ncbi:MAG: hypothetical protein HMLKMBBP_00713 [Planctomycetes bacterium]|nr:hypothetical protein [Planctomycetota bacterium]
MREYFSIDPSKPIPRGPDVTYECLKCGDVIPSVEQAGSPWHCRCHTVKLDHDAHRASFEDPSAVRGIRESGSPGLGPRVSRQPPQ